MGKGKIQDRIWAEVEAEVYAAFFKARFLLVKGTPSLAIFACEDDEVTRRFSDSLIEVLKEAKMSTPYGPPERSEHKHLLSLSPDIRVSQIEEWLDSSGLNHAFGRNADGVGYFFFKADWQETLEKIIAKI